MFDQNAKSPFRGDLEGLWASQYLNLSLNAHKPSAGLEM